MKNIESIWYKKGLLSFLLIPLSVVYCCVIKIRYLAYKLSVLKSHQLHVPVIIVGNISVGGTGKTPLVIYLTALLIENGYRPGIISRGYKGKSEEWPQLVEELSDPYLVGDEPVLLAKRCRCAVA